MKAFKIIILSILILCSTVSHSQKLESFKYRVSSLLGRNYENQKWGDWFEPSYSNSVKDVLIVLDLPNKKFSFYSTKTQEYSIVNIPDTNEDSEKTTFKFDCVDNENRRCSFIFIFQKSSQKEPILYQLYQTMELCYFLKSE
jgi:hypothetical protein